MPLSYPGRIPDFATNKKPAFGAVIDRAHPLAQQLVGYWPFLEGGGGLATDPVTGLPNHFVNTSTAWTSSPFGYGLNSNAGSRGTHDTAATIYRIQPPLTAMVQFYQTGANQSNAPYAGIYYNDGTDTSPFVCWDISQTGNLFTYSVNNAGTLVTATNATFGPGSGPHLFTCFLTHNGSVIQGTCVYDGPPVQMEQTSTQASAGAITYPTAAPLCFGYYPGVATRFCNATILAGALWNRVLSAQEMFSMNLAPYQVLTVPGRRLWLNALSTFLWQQLTENQVPAEYFSPWEVNTY